MFKGVSLKQKRILEVGCGMGYLSQYLALTHPKATIFALDEAEGDGSSKDVLKVMGERNEQIGIENIEVIKADFTTWETEEPFDYVIAKNAVHHLPWKEPITLKSDAFIFKNQKIHDDFLDIFQRLRSMVRTGGHLIFGDVSRANVLRLLPRSVSKRIRTVNWRIKPTAKEWLSLMEEAGFEDVGFRCDVPYKLRSLTKVWRPLRAYWVFPDLYFYARNPE
jgi:cyclopropane fatty-acyl-phospholipid synthase-like methyltransferase